MKRLHWVVMIMMVAMALFAGGIQRAFAADAYIADLVDAKFVRLATAKTIPADFARYVGQDLRDAAASVASAARDAANRELNRHMRFVRGGIAGAEGVKSADESLERVVAMVRGIEVQMMNDLRALTAPEQADSFVRFERARRRAALFGSIAPMTAFDAVSLIDSIKVGRSPELEAAVLSAEVTLDAPLIEFAAARLEYFRCVRDEYGDREKVAKARGGLQISQRDLQRACVTAWRGLTATADPAALELLLLQRMQLFIDAYNRVIEQPTSKELLPAPVREIQALELTSAQRKQVDERVRSFEAAYLNEVRACFASLDEATMKNEPSEAVNKFLGDRDRLRVALEKDVLLLLTVDQRRSYDDSPLLERPSNWDIADEPGAP